MHLLLQIFLTVLGTLLCYIPYCGIMIYIAHHSFKPIRSARFAISFILFSVIVYITAANDNHFILLAWLMHMGLFTIFILINSTCNLYQAISIAFFTYFYISLIEVFFVFLALNTIGLTPNDIASPQTLFVIFFKAGFSLFLIRYIPYRWFEKILAIPHNIEILCLLTLILLLIVTSSLKIDLRLLAPTVTTLLICSVLIILFIRQAKSDLKRQQTLRDYSTYLPILDEMILGMQQRQHLYKNQFLSLSQLLETGDMDSLKDTLAEITAQNAKQNASYHFLQLQNRLLAGLLYTKLLFAQAHAIHFDITIKDDTCPCRCSDPELVDCVCILFDHVIARCHENDSVTLTIKNTTLPKKQTDKTESSVSDNSNPSKQQMLLTFQTSIAYQNNPSVRQVRVWKDTVPADQIQQNYTLHALQKKVKKYHGSLLVESTPPKKKNETENLTIRLYI